MLDRALLKAEHSKQNGAISAVEYHKVCAKIDSLKKLAFTEDYEKLQDRETYEYMKYKVAAEVGGPEEQEAFRLYEKTHIQEKPEEECTLEPVKTCKHITRLVPKLVEVQECVDVPKEICNRSKQNPRKVKKPIIKNWCYTPAENDDLQNL